MTRWLLLTVGVVVLLSVCWCSVQPPVTGPVVRPDTLRPPVYVPPAPIVQEEVPRVVVVPRKKEPAKRKQLEQAPRLLHHVTLDPVRGVEIATIDTAGQWTVSRYPFPEDFAQVRIDSAGRVEVKRLKWFGRLRRTLGKSAKPILIGAAVGGAGALLLKR